MYCKNACFLMLCGLFTLVSTDARAVSSVRVLGMPAATSPVKPSVVRTGSAANSGANMAAAVKKATAGSGSQIVSPSVGRSASKLPVASTERIPTAKAKINVKSIANPGVASVETQQIVALSAINDKVSELESRVNDINIGDYYTQNEIDNLVSDTLDGYDVAVDDKIDAKLDDYDAFVDEKIDSRLAEIESVASVENISAIRADTDSVIAETDSLRAETENNAQNIADNINQINELRESLAATNALLEKTIEKTEEEKVNSTDARMVTHLDPSVFTNAYLKLENKKQDVEQ